MFKKIKKAIEESEEKRKERERIEQEKIEQKKQRLLALDEKELLVELIFSMKNIEKEQKKLLEKIDSLDAAMWTNNLNDSIDKL